jgi:hypothetical protein
MAALPAGKENPATHWIGGRQSRSGHGGEEKNSQPPPGIEPWNPDRPARSPVVISTELSKIIFRKNLKEETICETHT